MSTLSATPPPANPSAVTAPAHASQATVPDHLYLVVVGHVDHGKSTLIGRLLFDTHSVPDGKKERIEAACKAEGMEFEYAFLMDALLEEQAQNITMDTTRVPFHTERRSFTIIDAPGHKEFLKNMITGAASADAAVLLVDAQEGLREQTRRHCFLLSLLGLRQIVVAVNKMDLVDYRQEVFDRIRTELGEFLGKLGVEPSHFVPISAKLGEGLLKHSERMSWYRGPTLLETLERFHANPPASGGPLRLSVQDVYRFDARRIVAGLVESGRISVGDPIEFAPGGKRSRVKSIETWPAVTPPTRGPVGAGREVAVTLEDELFVERGQVGSSLEDRPYSARTFTARVFWIHDEPLRSGELIPLKLGTQLAEARVLGIQRTLDAVTLETGTGTTGEVKVHEVAEIRMRVRKPLAFDIGGKVPALGRFVLMRGRRIGGGGVIDSVVEEPIQSRGTGPVNRSAILGHRGCIIWMTGLSGAGKSTLAQALEQRLLNSGVLSAILDGDVLRTGLSRNLGFTPDDRSENLRRATELAIHLADAGVVVIAALISPFRADRSMAAERAKERDIPFAEIFVNASLAECERRDPKQLYRKARAGEIKQFTGIDSPYEPPLAPDLELRTDRESANDSIERLTQMALSLARPSEQADAGADI
ncbi:MAG TPA: adenylyl-sulfate kinase [Opitutaceae bacterium]|nr:adenylyl-sulfate kinase [Opitutaceae bacterium]